MSANERASAIASAMEGDRYLRAGQLDLARQAFDKARAAFESVLSRSGETPEKLRDVSLSLKRLGDVERARGDLAAAYGRYEECYEIDRKILALTGETPEALLDLSVSLERLGDVERARGELATACARYEKCYEIDRKILALTGETPEALRGVSVGLVRLGDVERARGELVAAYKRYEEQYQITRKILALTDETPEALRDVSVSLDRLGAIEQARGDLAAAHRRYEECYGIARKILALTGEMPEALRNVAISLQRLGDVDEARGELATANKRYEECYEIDRKILALTGETPEALRDVSIGLGRLGGMEQARGELAAAHRRYEECYGIARKILVLTGETPEALRDVSISLQRLGEVEQARGELAAAHRRYKESYEINRKILVLTGETPDALRGVNISVQNLGDVENARGELAAAYGHYEECYKLDRKILALTGETPEALRGVSLSLERLGDVEEARGELAAAYGRYEQHCQIACKILALTGETPEALCDVSVSLDRLGAIEQARGELAAAHGRYEECYGIARKILALTGETPRALRVLNLSLMRLGDVERARGELAKACTRYEKCYEINRKILALTGETPVALRGASLSLVRLGDVERARGELAAACSRYEEGYEINCKVLALVGEMPEALQDVNVSLDRLGAVEAARGELARSLARTVEQLRHLVRISTQLATWPRDAAVLSYRLVALARAGALGVQQALAHRAELWSRLHEHIDLADVQVLDQAQADVARFHGSWLRLALEQAAERMPEVLAAMQGRKIAALVLEELEQQRPPSGASSELWQRFRRLRTELRRLALDLRAISGGAARPRDDPRNRDAGALTVSFEVWRQREAQYKAMRAEYRACLTELARQPGFEALQPPQMDAAELRPTLAKGQALLIVVQPPAEGEAQSTPQALLLRREGHELVPLPALHAAVAYARRLAHAPQQLVGKRYTASRADSAWQAIDKPMTGSLNAVPLPAEPSPAQSEASDLSSQEAFWSQLRTHLQGLHTLHVVTHGELHMLPLAHESPAGIQVHQYPGLVFYWLQLKASQPRSADAGLAIQVHSPAQGEVPPPIPFVHAEAQLAQSLWSPVHSPLPLEQNISPRVVHLAGHGEAGRGQDAALLVGPAQVLGLHELLRSRIRPEVVYLSACLVGRTSEDLDGDPLGMVSAFFMRGARSVVAPLVPISDLYAPILAVLFHWELKRQHDDTRHLDATRALKWAKGRLEQGDWPAEVARRVREAYSATFAGELAEVLHGRVLRSDGSQADTHQELMTVMSKWFGELLGPARLSGLRDQIDIRRRQQGPDAAAHWGAEQLAEMLVEARTRLKERPEVQELLRYMQVYGAPRDSGRRP